MQGSLRRQYLEAMGIQSWVRRAPDPGPEVQPDDQADPQHPDTEVFDNPVASEVKDVTKTFTQPVEVQSRSEISTLDWDALQLKVSECQACELHQTRTQTVFGVGDRQADLMIIGEAPGADEDRQGEPFVGRAGQLLNAMLKAIGLERRQVFIANILKCRPPGNRDPHVDEALHCDPFLKRQIELVKPKAILAVGRVAAQNLLHTDVAVGKLRNREHILDDLGVPVIVTYHPAYLLRSPDQKGKAWLDLLQARRLLQ